MAGLIPRDLATQKVAKWQVHSSAAYKGQQRNTQNVDGFQVFQRPSINSPQIDMVDMCCFKRVCCFSASLFFAVCFIPTCQEQLPDLGAQRRRFIYSNLISIGFH